MLSSTDTIETTKKNSEVEFKEEIIEEIQKHGSGTSSCFGCPIVLQKWSDLTKIMVIDSIRAV